MKQNRFLAHALCPLALFLGTASAWAHHSFAMFDETKATTMEGVVKEFQWTNPHSWIFIDVKDDKGSVVTWNIETGSPLTLKRLGWSSKSLQPGDAVTVVINPRKDGTSGGSLVSVQTPKGEVLYPIVIGSK